MAGRISLPCACAPLSLRRDDEPGRFSGGVGRRRAAGRGARLRHPAHPRSSGQPTLADRGPNGRGGGHHAAARRELRVRQRLPPSPRARPGGRHPRLAVRRPLRARPRGRLERRGLSQARAPLRPTAAAHRSAERGGAPRQAPAGGRGGRPRGTPLPPEWRARRARAGATPAAPAPHWRGRAADAAPGRPRGRHRGPPAAVRSARAADVRSGHGGRNGAQDRHPARGLRAALRGARAERHRWRRRPRRERALGARIAPGGDQVGRDRVGRDSLRPVRDAQSAAGPADPQAGPPGDQLYAIPGHAMEAMAPFVAALAGR